MTAPQRHSFNYSIAVPASFVSDVPHLREKTFRIGSVGRAAAIFRVDEIIIYPDMPNTDQRADLRLVQAILSYMETPQYLRRRLFKLVPELQYAGTLPPLRTAHHPTANKIANLKLGELREGVVLSTTGEDSLIDVGVEKPALIHGSRLKKDSRVTVKITERSPQLKGVLTDAKTTETYWGYKVSVSKAPLGQLLESGQFDLKIATSRKGKPVTAVMDDLREKWRDSSKILVAFGAPTQGLYEIVNREHKNLEDEVTYVVNAIPAQATETIRTEEAVYATLSILNILSC